jgi:predicted transcriptional regulator
MTRFGTPHRTLRMDVPQPMATALDRLARQGGRPVVAVVREALAEYVARHRGGGR